MASHVPNKGEWKNNPDFKLELNISFLNWKLASAQILFVDEN